MQPSTQLHHNSNPEGPNHTPTLSLGSSVSFHTVHTSLGCGPTQPLERDNKTFEEVCLHASPPGVEESLDEYSTPLGVDDFCSTTPSECFNRSNVGEMTSGVEQEGEGGVQEEEEEGGYAIKCLPNGMKSLPPPSVESRSLDLSFSPCSKRLTLATVAPSEGSTPLQSATESARLHSPFQQYETTMPMQEQESSGIKSQARSDSSSSTLTMTTQPSQPSSTTTPTLHQRQRQSTTKSGSTVTSSTRSHSRSRSRALGAQQEWGANFWCVISDPASPANTFFANPQTGECRWVLPRGTIVLPPSGNGEWWELLDEMTGREYYYHTGTRETRWTKPETQTQLVIPMRAVQMSHHLVRTQHSTQQSKPRKESHIPTQDGTWSSSTSRVNPQGRVGVEQGGEDSSIIITTPLRPRTKSLPQQSRQRRMSHLSKRTPLQPRTTDRPPTFVRDGQKTVEAQEDLAVRARRSIVLHDQRALALARQTSTRTLTFSSNFDTPKLVNRPSNVSTPSTVTRSCTASIVASRDVKSQIQIHRLGSVDQSEHCSGLGLDLKLDKVCEPVAVSAWPIRKVGKGLAYQVTNQSSNDASRKDPKFRLRTHRSLPFVSPTISTSTSTSTTISTSISSGTKGTTNEKKQIVRLPSDIVHALAHTLPNYPSHQSNPLPTHPTDSQLTLSIHHPKHKDKQEHTKKRSRLLAWKSLPRCTRSTNIVTPDTPKPSSSFTNSTLP